MLNIVEQMLNNVEQMLNNVERMFNNVEQIQKASQGIWKASLTSVVGSAVSSNVNGTHLRGTNTIEEVCFPRSCFSCDRLLILFNNVQHLFNIVQHLFNNVQHLFNICSTMLNQT